MLDVTFTRLLTTEYSVPEIGVEDVGVGVVVLVEGCVAPFTKSSFTKGFLITSLTTYGSVFVSSTRTNLLLIVQLPALATVNVAVKNGCFVLKSYGSA